MNSDAPEPPRMLFATTSPPVNTKRPFAPARCPTMTLASPVAWSPFCASASRPPVTVRRAGFPTMFGMPTASSADALTSPPSSTTCALPFVAPISMDVLEASYPLTACVPPVTRNVFVGSAHPSDGTLYGGSPPTRHIPNVVVPPARLAQAFVPSRERLDAETVPPRMSIRAAPPRLSPNVKLPERVSGPARRTVPLSRTTR